jgi:hypothetical protein
MSPGSGGLSWRPHSLGLVIVDIERAGVESMPASRAVDVCSR